MNAPLLAIDLPGTPKVRSGKVRELFDLGDSLLMVATDRISAFDVIMAEGIPDKGRVLTGISRFWFEATREWMPNHVLDWEAPPGLGEGRLTGRAMRVRKARPLPIECVVRGYLAGSGWKEYREHGTLAGAALPAGMRESERLPGPVFTPATKEDSGHDINITREEAARIVGRKVFDEVEAASLRLYAFAQGHAAARGILVADTKFEFGLDGDRVILIDEVLTPDSSRFWPADGYAPGRGQKSFDKQFLRDYLESIPWNKQPPPPPLPPEVVAGTRRKYLEAFRLITGRDLDA